MANKEKYAATLTIYRAGKMSDKGKKEIAVWLKHCAKRLVKEGKNYASRFTARYYY